MNAPNRFPFITRVIRKGPVPKIRVLDRNKVTVLQFSLRVKFLLMPARGTNNTVGLGVWSHYLPNSPGSRDQHATLAVPVVTADWEMPAY